MRLLVVDIPEDPARLPGWLEQHLIGPDLGSLVAELGAFSSGTARVRPLSEILGRHEAEILERGLGVLPRGVLRELMASPSCLLELQERILIEGGPYWTSKSAQVWRNDPMMERGATRLTSFIEAETEPSVLSMPRPNRRRRFWTPLAAAAALLIGVGLGWLLFGRGSNADADWGWNRPDVLARQGTREEHLNRLADAADEWFAKRPEDAAGVARRIGEFRRGCSALLLSDQRQLSASDRDWLKERCRVWAGKLDGHLAAIESGVDPLQVRMDADETARKLIEALKQRAATS